LIVVTFTFGSEWCLLSKLATFQLRILPLYIYANPLTLALQTSNVTSCQERGSAGNKWMKTQNELCKAAFQHTRGGTNKLPSIFGNGGWLSHKLTECAGGATVRLISFVSAITSN